MDHLGAKQHCQQVTDCHPEHMVERERHTNGIRRGNAADPSGEVRTVQQIAMTEGRPLGTPGSATRELNIDGIIAVQPGCGIDKQLSIQVLAECPDLVEMEDSAK